MKIKLSSLLITLIMTILVLISNCSKDDDNGVGPSLSDLEKNLIATWECTSATKNGESTDTEVGDVMVFRDDFSGSRRDGGSSSTDWDVHFSWSTKDNNLTINIIEIEGQPYAGDPFVVTCNPDEVKSGILRTKDIENGDVYEFVWTRQ